MDMFNAGIYPQDHRARQAIDCEVRLSHGTGDEEYLAKLRTHLARSLEKSRSQLLIYNAGTDCLSDDPLGNLDVSAEGIVERDRIVFEMCLAARVPLVMLLSGGYQQSNAAVIAKSIANLQDKLQLWEIDPTLLVAQAAEREKDEKKKSKSKIKNKPYLRESIYSAIRDGVGAQQQHRRESRAAVIPAHAGTQARANRIRCIRISQSRRPHPASSSASVTLRTISSLAVHRDFPHLSAAASASKAGQTGAANAIRLCAHWGKFGRTEEDKNLSHENGRCTGENEQADSNAMASVVSGGVPIGQPVKVVCAKAHIAPVEPQRQSRVCASSISVEDAHEIPRKRTITLIGFYRLGEAAASLFTIEILVH